jgi:hypothetical protein
MNNEKYEELIRNGERVDWYETMVPEALITPSVRTWASGLESEIHKLEGELSDLNGVAAERRKSYLKVLKNNLKNAPYSLNGDIYLIKKKRIESQIEEEKEVKSKKTTRKRTTKTSRKTSARTTKNSSKIFGKK